MSWPAPAWSSSGGPQSSCLSGPSTFLGTQGKPCLPNMSSGHPYPSLHPGTPLFWAPAQGVVCIWALTNLLPSVPAVFQSCSLVCSDSWVTGLKRYKCTKHLLCAGPHSSL